MNEDRDYYICRMITGQIRDTIKSTVNSFLPDARVLLFGSRARGESAKDSDYDLLIVTKQTFAPRAKIGWEGRIRKALVNTLNLPFDVIIQSKKEVSEKRSVRTYCLLRDERCDRDMTAEERNYLEQWLEKAEHDLLAAQLIIEQRPVILDISCFHSQQAVEKYLKTFLIYHKKDFPKTHNLDLLLKHCSDICGHFKAIDVKNLEDFAVRARYPHDFLLPTQEEAEEFYQIAIQTKALVLKEIRIN